MYREEERLEPMELKYCERCGGLWLRRKGLARPYCTRCAPKMAETLEPRLKLPVGKRVRPEPDLEGCGLELLGLAEGGQR